MSAMYTKHIGYWLRAHDDCKRHGGTHDQVRDEAATRLQPAKIHRYIIRQEGHMARTGLRIHE